MRERGKGLKKKKKTCATIGKKNNNVKKKENKINNVSRGRWEDGKMREREKLWRKKKRKRRGGKKKNVHEGKLVNLTKFKSKLVNFCHICQYFREVLYF